MVRLIWCLTMAGVTVDSTFENMSEDDWDWVFNINLQGVINSSRAFLPHLKQRPEAALINTSSIFGMIALERQSVYHTAKFAVRGFTESLAKELKSSSVQVHCVHPGHIGTNIVTNSRMNQSEESAGSLQRLVGKVMGLGNSKEELAAFFLNNGMHPSRASQIILNGVRKNRSRIMVGHRCQTNGYRPATDSHALRKTISIIYHTPDTVAQ